VHIARTEYCGAKPPRHHLGSLTHSSTPSPPHPLNPQASSKAIATPSSRSGGVSPHRTHHSAFAKLPPDGSPLPSRHHADSPSDEVADVEGALSPEAVRFASYYGDADELRARNFQRGVIKFNADPKAVSGQRRRPAACEKSLTPSPLPATTHRQPRPPLPRVLRI
jgi:hypothetical protein